MRADFDIQAECSAAQRNARDLQTIRKARALVDEFLDSVADIAPIEHPDSRWHPLDLKQFLQSTLRDLAAEERRAREPVLTPSDCRAR